MRPSAPRPTAPDDTGLTKAALLGNQQAIDSLAQRLECVPRFLRCCNARTGAPLAAEALRDLAQDVLALVWSKLDSYRGESALETWVYRFCYLQLKNAIRRLRRTSVELEQPDLVAEEPTTTSGGDETEHLLRSLDRLPAADADLLRNKNFDDLTFEQIARRCSQSVNTIKSRYYRALDRLRLSMRTLSHDGDPQ